MSLYQNVFKQAIAGVRIFSPRNAKIFEFYSDKNTPIETTQEVRRICMEQMKLHDPATHKYSLEIRGYRDGNTRAYNFFHRIVRRTSDLYL